MAGRENLLRLMESEIFKIAHLDRGDLPRIRELMAKYHDLPMDLADAAIVRVAERERINRVFTVDQKGLSGSIVPRASRDFDLLP